MVQTWKTNIGWTAATYCNQSQASFDCGRTCREKWRLLRLLGEALRSSKVAPNNTDEETICLMRKIELFFVADMWLSLSRMTIIPFISSFFVHFFLDIVKYLRTCVSTEFEVAECTITRIAGLLTRDTHEHHLHNYMITPHSEHLSSPQSIPWWCILSSLLCRKGV